MENNIKSGDNPEVVIKVTKDQKILVDGIDWENLLYKLKHLEIRILEHVYFKKSEYHENLNSFDELCLSLKKYNYSKKTIKRKIDFLLKLEIIKVLKTSCLVIEPNPKIYHNVKMLCTMWNTRDTYVKY